MIENINKDKPFALIEKDGRLNLYQGDVHHLQEINDIHEIARRENTDVVFVLPYHSIRERGFEAIGNEPVLGLSVSSQFSFKTFEKINDLPDIGMSLNGEVVPDLGDDEYAEMVADFQLNEIEKGLVSQTIISRKFKGRVHDLSLEKLLGTFKKIILQQGHYMAVLFYNPDDDQVIVAATPERHLEVTGTRTIMTPIAGTLRKEDRESFKERLDVFINDNKEINELFQVLDEEMKIMGVVCPRGGAVSGPYLREVGAVIHSEYNLIGKRTLHSIDALRETLHAPTVVGSPMESAARVIAKYEKNSRRYYAGEIGVYRRPRTPDPDGDIDAAILIRMAEFSMNGEFIVQSGGGLVRDSDPKNEAKESTAKAMGILRYFSSDDISPPYLTEDIYAGIKDEFESRNDKLSQFWFDKQNSYKVTTGEKLLGKNIVIINNEDNFAYMIEHLVKSFGANVTTMDTFDYDIDNDKSDITIIGPGPGNPNDKNHSRMVRLHEISLALLERNKPVLGICLGHQMLAIVLGIKVEQQKSSTQGMPINVVIDGTEYQLGFYNSFSPVMNDNLQNIHVNCDEFSRIIKMEGESYVGFQFHPESVMSKQGVELLYNALVKIIGKSI